MKRIRDYFILALIFACAVALTMTLKNAALVNAREPSHPLFRRPGGDEGETPPPEGRGLVIPGQGGEDKPINDPGEPGFTAIFPKGSISETVRVKFFNTGLPEGVPPPPNSVGPLFFFGAWSGKGATLCPFNFSILINVSYDDSGLSSSQEERLHLYVYNPAARAWVKSGGRVDIYKNVMTGFLALPTPFEAGGNTLFALVVDETPPPKQIVDESGITTLSIEGRQDFRFHVLPGTVGVGAYFEVTPLFDIPDTNTFKLINAVDIKAYKDDSQITDFPKPVSVEFDYDADALAGARLTIVTLKNECQQGGWVDAEELGYEVTRQGNRLVVEAGRPGVFGLAIKQQYR
jgi:hypothetical protein